MAWWLQVSETLASACVHSHCGGWHMACWMTLCSNIWLARTNLRLYVVLIQVLLFFICFNLDGAAFWYIIRVPLLN